MFCKQFLSLILVLISITLKSLLLLTGVNTTTTIDNKYLIGVHPERRSHYEPLSSGKNFNCLDGSGSIPGELVNDDYCDCRDASDEPGTAACPHGRFFCQNEGYIQRLIPSAWVNDGQCDCCDASDEYNSTKKTCENTCGVLGEVYRREQERFKEIADQGSAIRSQYKEQAKLKKEQNQQLLDQYRRELTDKENAIKKLEEELNFDFGPSNVFLPMKGKCFNYQEHEYSYTLCPFERATQQSINIQTELGGWAGWAGPSENPYSKQKYEGGLTCWNGPSRSAVVNIECGSEDKITSVVEPAKCEYVFNFITPAACPDLDPPEPEQQSTEQEHQEELSAVETPPSIEVEGDEGHEGTSYFDHEAEDEKSTDYSSDEKHDEL